MAELSPEVIAALKRDLAQCDEDRRTIAAATGRDEADSEWCAVIRLDRFRLALAALERIPELERQLDEAHAQNMRQAQRLERIEAAAWRLVGVHPDFGTWTAVDALRVALAAAPPLLAKEGRAEDDLDFRGRPNASRQVTANVEYRGTGKPSQAMLDDLRELAAEEGDGGR